MAGPGRILLTGGAGFIGSALARALVADGWTVTVLDLLTYAGRRAHLDGVDAELVVGDVCDAALVRRLMTGQDAVVHAAAESHVARSLIDPAPFLRTNIEGARVVLEAAAAAGVAHAVHLSTDEVFGEAPAEGRFGPDAPLRPGNLYAATKAAAEALVHAIRHTRGFPVSVVRCTNNYGPRQHGEKAIPTWIRLALAGEPLTLHGDGLARRDWLHVDDFAAGVVALLRRGRPGDVHHFAGGNERTNAELAAQLAALCGGGRLTHVEERPGQDRRYALNDDNTRAALGWSPRVNLRDGLAATVTWAQEDPRRVALE
ncbi:NAD-dependent epimerase/dehydratase family protein [Myxococcota bacterium]|nr:NAD-dependent epimerase/dehydratase family protein [Myxococcota bacterium]